MPPRARKTAPPKKDFAALLAAARLPETIVPVCLRGDLAAQHESLERELDKLLGTPVDRVKFASDGRGELQQQILDLEAQMEEATVEFRFRGLPRREWHALVAEHPPRVGPDGKVPDEDALGVNAETFFMPMLRACLIDPDMDDEQWFQLTEALTSRQLDDLWNAAWGLNRRDVSVPFSFAARRQIPSSDGE